MHGHTQAQRTEREAHRRRRQQYSSDTRAPRAPPHQTPSAPSSCAAVVPSGQASTDTEGRGQEGGGRKGSGRGGLDSRGCRWRHVTRLEQSRSFASSIAGAESAPRVRQPTLRVTLASRGRVVRHWLPGGRVRASPVTCALVALTHPRVDTHQQGRRRWRGRCRTRCLGDDVPTWRATPTCAASLTARRRPTNRR